MKLALQLPVVRVAKTTAKPTPKTTAKTTARITAKTTPSTLRTMTKPISSVVKTSPKVSSPSAKALTKSGTSKSSSVSSSSIRYCGLYPCSHLTLKPFSLKTSAKTTASTLAPSSSTRRCIGAACSKLTAKTSPATSAKGGASAKSSTRSSGSKTSSASFTTKLGTKVSGVSKSGTRVLTSVTGTLAKGVTVKRSSSSTRKVKPTSTSNPGSGDDSGAGSGDDGSDSSAATTSAGDDGSAATTSTGGDGAAATTSAADGGAAATTSASDDDSGDGSSPTSASGDDDSSATSTPTIPASTTTSTKPKSATLMEASTKTSSASTISAPSSQAVSPTGDAASTATTAVAKPRPSCSSPLAANETFQLYIYGTNTAIDGTPMQGLTNGATAVGFDVGYVSLDFTLDCTTGYVYWGPNSVLSGNIQAFSVKSQSTVVAPLGDSNNAPLICSLDSNLVLSCQYTSARTPDVFQSWAVSTGDAGYLAMSQSNSTGITLKAVPLSSNTAVTYSTHSTNQKLLSNGDFAASSIIPWSKFTQGKSSDMQLSSPAVNATGSCYAFAGMLAITPDSNFVNGYAWGGLSQPGVTLYMGEQLFVGYDVFLNYPAGLPSGVRCDIQVKATDHDTLSYVRYDSSSPAFVSFNTTTSASYNGTGSFSITAYCQGQPGGPWPALNLGFNNVRLLGAYDPTDVGAALTCGFKEARDAIQSATLQPYCSSLLSYSTPTTTSTQVISTTTTSTVTVNYGRRKRGMITAAPGTAAEPLRRRQLDPSVANSTTTSSTMTGEPSVLATFAPSDVTNACSVEAAPVSTTITVVTTTTTTLTAYATATKSPDLFILSQSGNRDLYVSRDSSGAVVFTSDTSAAIPFFIDDSGMPRSWQDPSLTLVDHYEPDSSTADNRIYIEAPSSASYTLTCRNQGRTGGSYFGDCQSSGPPNGNPVVYGFGWCPSTQGLYMIPNSSNVRCGGGYAFLGFFLVAYTG
ncbi:hypothetical protein KCU67_g5298, partial [Aureobasidium melanogenum]